MNTVCRGLRWQDYIFMAKGIWFNSTGGRCMHVRAQQKEEETSMCDATPA